MSLFSHQLFSVRSYVHRDLLDSIREARAHQTKDTSDSLDAHQKRLDANLKSRLRHNHVPDSVVEVAEVLRKTNARRVVHKHVVNPGGLNADPSGNYEKAISAVAFPSPMLLAPHPHDELLLSSPLTLFFVLKPMWLAHGVDVSTHCNLYSYCSDLNLSLSTPFSLSVYRPPVRNSLATRLRAWQVPSWVASSDFTMGTQPLRLWGRTDTMLML